MDRRNRLEVIMLRRKRGDPNSNVDFSDDDDFDEDNSSQGDNVPVQRNAANARERARMRVLSSAFGRLKTKLPNIPPDTKLSKLDTLRLATIYIKQLKTLVETDDHFATNEYTSNGNINNNNNNSSKNGFTNLYNGMTTTNMSWPFGFYHHHYQHQQRNQSTINNNTAVQPLSAWPTDQTNSALENVEHNSLTAISNNFVGDCNMKNSLMHLSKEYKNDQNIWYPTERRQLPLELTAEYSNMSNHHLHEHPHHIQNNETLQLWRHQYHENHSQQQFCTQPVRKRNSQHCQQYIPTDAISASTSHLHNVTNSNRII